MAEVFNRNLLVAGVSPISDLVSTRQRGVSISAYCICAGLMTVCILDALNLSHTKSIQEEMEIQNYEEDSLKVSCCACSLLL